MAEFRHKIAELTESKELSEKSLIKEKEEAERLNTALKETEAALIAEKASHESFASKSGENVEKIS